MKKIDAVFLALFVVVVIIVFWSVFHHKTVTDPIAPIAPITEQPTPAIHDICKDPNPPRDCLKG